MNFRYHIVYILLLFIGTGLVSCSKSKYDCFKTDGDLVKETRTLSDFAYIEVYNNVNVILTQSSVNSVEIEAGKNLMSEIIAEVINDTLILRNNNFCMMT